MDMDNPDAIQGARVLDHMQQSEHSIVWLRPRVLQSDGIELTSGIHIGHRDAAKKRSLILDQPSKDLRNPIAEDTHFCTSLTTRWIDDEYFQRLRTVLFQHDDQITAFNRRSHIEVERMDQAEAGERARTMSVAIVNQDAVPRLEPERFIAHKKFDRLYNAAGVGEIASHWKVIVHDLLWVCRHAVSSDI